MEKAHHFYFRASLLKPTVPNQKILNLTARKAANPDGTIC